MSLNDGSNQRPPHKRPGWSCFSWCFSGSPVHEYVDEPVASSVRSASKAAMPADTSREEDELHIKDKRRSRSKPKQQVVQDAVLINSSINQSQTPMISPKYNTRTRPVPPMIVTESTATTAILHSATTASPPEPKTPTAPAAATGDGYLGPAVGLSVLVVTLAAILLCGRVFAVLCLCAFLYLVPPLLTTVAREGREAKRKKKKKKYMEVDMNSGEYKKKVVLEGLLERNRRTR